MTKFNPYHDARGRFSSADAAASFTYAPGRSKAHDLAIARERERTGGAAKISAGEEKIRGMLKEGATVKLEGMDPEMVEPLANSIESVLKRYPAVKDAFGGFTTDDTPDGAFSKEDGTTMAAFVNSTRMIHMNNKYYGNRSEFDERYKASLEKKFHPEGTTLDAVAVHEMSHAIDRYVSEKTIPKFYSTMGWDKVSTRIWNNEIKAGKKNGNPVTTKSITESLSRYASVNPGEYLAEGLSEYLTSPNPRPAATKVGKRVESYIKKLDGGK